MNDRRPGFVERNAWLFLAGTLLPPALNGLVISTGMRNLGLIGWAALWRGLLPEVPEEPVKSEYSGPPTVAERNAMMDRIINRRP